MKKTLIVLSMFLFSISLFAQKTKLEIYYFHLTHRCPTCMSIEANTKKTLDTYFSKELKDGTIKLIVVNVEEAQNKKLSEKYQAFGSSLYLTKISNGKETKDDVTNFAFSYSRNQPDKFISGLKDKITASLK
jgi:hypothetical protein